MRRHAAELLLLACAHLAPGALGFANVVECNTTAGSFSLHIANSWSRAHKAGKRFLADVARGVFDDQLVYDVAPHQHVQFGAPEDAVRFPSLYRIQHVTVSLSGLHKSGMMHDSTGGTPQDSHAAGNCHLSVLWSHGKRVGGPRKEDPVGRLRMGHDAIRRIHDDFLAAGYQDLGHLKWEIAKRGAEAASDYPLLHRIHKCWPVVFH